GAGGAGGAATSQGGAGPTTSSMTTADTGATTTSSTTSATTATTTTSSTTAATTATTSGGGLTIDCDGTPCDISGGDVCCVDKNDQTATCKASCTGNETDVTCSQPADCPGQICCGTGGFPYSQVQCQDDCTGGTTLCEPGVTNCDPLSCGQSGYLPDGYFVCKP
ncbi:MAG TPA: hypothetical protein VL400_08315, partial [Polyangiaceae bacterium]|nr:hypothetical protein [Polyangiaceae bacterium]